MATSHPHWHQKIGSVFVYPSLQFKGFQSILSRKIRISRRTSSQSTSTPVQAEWEETAWEAVNNAEPERASRRWRRRTTTLLFFFFDEFRIENEQETQMHRSTKRFPWPKTQNPRPTISTMKSPPCKPTSQANMSKKKAASTKRGDVFVVRWGWFRLGLIVLNLRLEVVWFQL